MYLHVKKTESYEGKQFVLLSSCFVWINGIAGFLYDEKREDF